MRLAIYTAITLGLLAGGTIGLINKLSKLGTPTDEHPQRHYDPNWRVTIWYRQTECKTCQADADRLQKELGDGVTVQTSDQDTAIECKYMHQCTKTPYYMIERPGWDDQDRRADERGDKYLSYDELKAWVQATMAKGAK